MQATQTATQGQTVPTAAQAFMKTPKAAAEKTEKPAKEAKVKEPKAPKPPKADKYLSYGKEALEASIARHEKKAAEHKAKFEKENEKIAARRTRLAEIAKAK